MGSRATQEGRRVEMSAMILATMLAIRAIDMPEPLTLRIARGLIQTSRAAVIQMTRGARMVAAAGTTVAATMRMSEGVSGDYFPEAEKGE